MKLKISLYDKTLYFLDFVKVTYIAEWYNNIKSSIVGKS